MFMKTMAVGPLEDLALWLTGATTVAILRLWSRVSHAAIRTLAAARGRVN